MNKIIIDENYIKSLPLTTNRIEVAWNENVFFSKYLITVQALNTKIWPTSN